MTLSPYLFLFVELNNYPEGSLNMTNICYGANTTNKFTLAASSGIPENPPNPMAVPCE